MKGGTSVSLPAQGQDSLVFTRVIGSFGAHIEPGDIMDGIDNFGELDDNSDTQEDSTTEHTGRTVFTKSANEESDVIAQNTENDNGIAAEEA